MTTFAVIATAMLGSAAVAVAEQPVFRYYDRTLGEGTHVPGIPEGGLPPFVPAGPSVSGSGMAEEPVGVDLGSYAGDGGTVSCSVPPSLAWMSCGATAGKVVLTGRPPAPGTDAGTVVVTVGGTHTEVAVTVVASPFEPKPVAGSVRDLYLLVGTSDRFRIGSVNGKPSDWSCNNDGSPMPSAFRCEFAEDGTVLLSVDAPVSRGQRSLGIRLAHRGLNLGSFYRTTVNYGREGHRSPWESAAPREGEATVDGLDLHLVSGLPNRVGIGTYSGGDGGWGCFASSGDPLPQGVSCAFEDGRIELVGNPSGRLDGVWLSLSVFRDGAIRARASNLGKLFVEATPYPDAVATVPRTGTAAVTELSIHSVSGGANRIQVGTYTGGEGGWTCFSSSMNRLPAGLSCEFRNGLVELVGTPTGRGDGTWTNLIVARDGHVKAQGSIRQLYREAGAYRTATTSPAREGTATVVQEDLHLVSGASNRIQVGTYTGGEGGWTCFSSSTHSLPDGTWCEFRNGLVELVGTPTGRGDGVWSDVIVARDGLVRAKGNIRRLYRDSMPYLDGTRSPSRGGTATVIDQSMAFAVEEEVRMPVATYAGGEGGWTCFSGNAPLPPGLRCEFVDGTAYLAGRVEAKVEGYYWSIVVARDGHVKAIGPLTGVRWK